VDEREGQRTTGSVFVVFFLFLFVCLFVCCFFFPLSLLRLLCRPPDFSAMHRSTRDRDTSLPDFVRLDAMVHWMSFLSAGG